MSPVSTRSVVLICFALCAVLPFTHAYTSNTAACINSSPGLFACDGLQSLTGGNVTACCAAVRQWASLSCFCNPALLDYAPEVRQLAANLPVLSVLCSQGQPAPLQVASIPAGNCPANLTQPGACGVPDVLLDGARIQAFLEIVGATNIPNNTEFRAYLEQRLAKNVTYLFQSSGFFNGPTNFIDYFSILNRYLNGGYTGLDSFDLVPGSVTVNANGLSVLAAVNATWYEGQPWEQQATGITNWNLTFVPCSATLQNLVWGIDDNLAFFFTKGAPSTFETCTRIQEICTGKNQQFKRLVDCVDFYSQLPTATCNRATELQGNNTQCRQLHLQIAPFNPAMHCPHVGVVGGPDPSGAYRCCDGGPNCSEFQGVACEAVLNPLDQPQCQFGANAAGRLARVGALAPAAAPSVSAAGRRL